mmetsp:Transcript_32156/g.68049  ORF Transcript_32156/g.68049 Transcript_32156/m.68049 type:complete len:282 (+) Transcript_32156:220-1065(+)|eukprot:CAMPEP_0183736700 /NCGR_PEP_ID=MMETSP0737-20130205/50012_1 /TAXON_ID=385413 /ORGANISM="Thalassiosira miniscula, Strain CCMP1093" /LENGTH=281 /DNA_ID=CAMNT_0025970773 /DNA_START=184 /DNA_END=1029 /DNA_ORIENTATION=+
MSTILLFIVTTLCLHLAFGTESQCHLDCRSSNRPVGPTRPWDATDPLRNSLHLTRPYPYHIGAADVDEYVFPEFCKLGCTYFFVSSDERGAGSSESTLDQCLGQCDDKYSYNSSTPPYNDLAEMARLECRDGCLMALKRCQPGYYCLQVSFGDERIITDNGLDEKTANSVRYTGGEMIPCPAGTFRDVSYNAVTECTPCPPNYFREGVKGRSSSDCSPCPAGTSAASPGNDSIKNCLRCPAGTFSTKASFCACITPQACDGDLASPADAEKRDSVPYIGRW